MNASKWRTEIGGGETNWRKNWKKKWKTEKLGWKRKFTKWREKKEFEEGWQQRLKTNLWMKEKTWMQKKKRAVWKSDEKVKEWSF